MAINETAELNKWFVKKAEVVHEGASKLAELRSGYAAMGYEIPCGELERGIVAVNSAIRKALSAANMEIVQEQIGIELEETQHDYKILLLTSRLSLESDIQDLKIALALELGNLAKTLTTQEEVIKRTGEEIERRKVALATQKRVLDLQVIDLQKQLDSLDSSTYSAERVLLDAKLETLRIKLLIIPELESLIEAEKDILQYINQNVSLEQQRIDATDDLIDAKRALLPYIHEKTEAVVREANAEAARVEVEEDRLILANSRAELENDRLTAAIQLENTGIALENSRRTLLAQKQDIQRIEAGYRRDMVAKNTAMDKNISEIREAHETTIRTLKSQLDETKREIKIQVQAIELAARQEVTISRVDQELYMIDHTDTNSTTRRTSYARTRTAQISAEANVTASLIHLIGS